MRNTSFQIKTNHQNRFNYNNIIIISHKKYRLIKNILILSKLIIIIAFNCLLNCITTLMTSFKTIKFD